MESTSNEGSGEDQDISEEAEEESQRGILQMFRG